MPDTFKNPFRGLYPYLEIEQDARLFFGRDKQIKEIIDRLKISRLTVLYGKSGVGKSSFLRAGVTYGLRRQMDKDIEKYGIPRFAVVTFPPLKDSDSSEDSGQHQYTWYDQPLSNLRKHIQAELQETVEKIFKRKNIDPDEISWPDPNLSFVETLEYWTELLAGQQEGECAELFIILDQFEDYLLSHLLEDNGYGKEETFARQFCRAVNNRRLYINFLISIRDSSFLQLSRFKGRIPDVMSRGWELEPLDWNSGQEVIEKTVEKYNELYGVNAPVVCEDKLVEEVLKGIWNEPSLSEKEQNIPDQDISLNKKYIEAPYLQIVMMRLCTEESKSWEKQDGSDERYLRADTLKRLGGVKGILYNHIDEKIKSLKEWEQDIAAKMFKYLVTSSGKRYAYSVGDLAALIYDNKDTESKRKALTKILDKLADSKNRILRTVKSSNNGGDDQYYEVFYDVLAKSILDWSRNSWEQLKKSLDDLKKQIENDFRYCYKKAEYLKKKAEHLKNNKDYQEAIKYYNHAVKLDPEHYYCWYHLATSLKELGDNQKDRSEAQQKSYRDAIDGYDQALRIRPDDYDCWYHRAISLKKLGDNQKQGSKAQQKSYRDAINSYEQAIKKRLDKDNFNLYYDKGRLEYELGEKSKAIESFDEASNLRPYDNSTRRYLTELKNI